MTEEKTMEGTVKWFNSRKRYGFIKGNDGEDYFVHHAALKDGRFLRENDRVSFEPTTTDRGRQAQNVVLLQKGSDSPEGEEAPTEETTEAPAEEAEEVEVEEEQATEEAEEEKKEE